MSGKPLHLKWRRGELLDHAERGANKLFAGGVAGQGPVRDQLCVCTVMQDKMHETKCCGVKESRLQQQQ